MATTPSSGTPLLPNQTDPAFAGERGYRALGAYSSARDNYATMSTPGETPTAPSTRVLQPDTSVSGREHAIVAPTNQLIAGATQFEDRLGITHDNPTQDLLSADRDARRRMGSTVICTEVVRRGDATQYDLTIEYRFVEKLPHFVVRGYRVWALPYVSLMRKSELVYKLTRPLARAFMQESAALLGLRKHSLLGAAVILVGTPFCAVIGAISLPLLTPCEA